MDERMDERKAEFYEWDDLDIEADGDDSFPIETKVNLPTSIGK